MTDFDNIISYAGRFQERKAEADLIKRSLNYLSVAGNSGKCDCDLNRLKGVLDIAVSELNVYSTTILSIIAGLCPDVDTKDFPEKIKEIVKGYRKITNPPFKVLSKNTGEYLDYILAAAGDLRAVLFAIADNVYRLRQLDENLSDAGDILTFSEVVYIPVCHRLGFYRLKSEMEDLVLRRRKPEVYRQISEKIKRTAKERDAVIKSFIRPVEQMLSEHKLKYRIKGRTKSVASIYAKMQKQGIPFEKVFDLFAIRIIIDSKPSREKSDCWHAFSVVTNIYKPDVRRLRDWITKPRDNGYESLHITVQQPDGKFVEVQIRTERMDDEAENGLAAHWRYKGGKSDSSVNDYLQRIRKAIERKEVLGDEDSYSSRHLSKDLFVFTPTGELKKLKQGATVLDFAFAIHSEVGIRCAGARINGKATSIKQQLQNGDMVEIITSKNQKPALDWINYVNSTRAKSRIKKAVDERRYKEAEEGKEMLQRRLRNWKMDFTQDVLERLSAHFKTKTITDLYRDIFLEKIELATVKKVLSGALDDPGIVETDEDDSLKTNRESKTGDALVVDEIENMNYKLAGCCHPVPGDAIFGFVTVARGITIHREDCPNASSMKERYPYRVLPARWRNREEKSNFRTDIYIKGADREGVLSEVTKVISSYAGIVSINLKSIGRHFQGKITVMLHDRKQVRALVKKLSQHRDIVDVYRVGDINQNQV